MKILSIGRISDQKNYLPVLKSLKEFKINNIKFEYKICYGSISDLVLFNNIKKYTNMNKTTKFIVTVTPRPTNNIKLDKLVHPYHLLGSYIFKCIFRYVNVLPKKKAIHTF